MNIIHYQAKLNSGKSITEESAVGTKLTWDSRHWSPAPDLIEKNTVVLNDSGKGLLLQADLALTLQSFTETMCFTENNPITVELDAVPDSGILAYYYFKDWWTRPAFLKSFEEVPGETAMLLYREKGAYHFLLALPGKVFRAHFEGLAGCKNIRLILSADSSGYTRCSETAMLAVSDTDPFRCIEKGMRYAAELYHIPLRGQRSYPPLFEKIGWCSWDAFYKDVNETGLAAKAEEIRREKLPFGWVLIDDGWQDYKNEKMISYGTNAEKFPEGLSGAAEKIKQICGIDQIGVWHAFSGYWCGIDPDGRLAKEHPERFIASHQGKLLPKPDAEAAYLFFADWYRDLKEQGIRFVKVDSQSSTRQHYRTNTPIGETSLALHRGLDRAVGEFFDGSLINCMGMALEDVLQRPLSGLSRNSDDFFPMEEESFKEHLLENVYNTIWHNAIYYGDWDMFWSNHPCARKHALLRALSGGPVYVSDRVGETVRCELMPLCYEDGTILRAEKGAVPTADCLLRDPEKSGYLKLQNVCGDVGYLAVYSFSEKRQSPVLRMADFSMWAGYYDGTSAFSETCSAPETESASRHTEKQYAVYDVFSEKGFTAATEEEWQVNLEGNGYAFYQIASVLNGIAVFGRDDKYLSSHAITGRKDSDSGCTIRIREMGPVRIYSDHSPVCIFNGEALAVTSLGKSDQLTGAGFYRIEMPVNTQGAEIHIG